MKGYDLLSTLDDNNVREMSDLPLRKNHIQKVVHESYDSEVSIRVSCKKKNKRINKKTACKFNFQSRGGIQL